MGTNSTSRHADSPRVDIASSHVAPTQSPGRAGESPNGHHRHVEDRAPVGDSTPRAASLPRAGKRQMAGDGSLRNQGAPPAYEGPTGRVFRDKRRHPQHVSRATTGKARRHRRGAASLRGRRARPGPVLLYAAEDALHIVRGRPVGGHLCVHGRRVRCARAARDHGAEPPPRSRARLRRATRGRGSIAAAPAGARPLRPAAPCQRERHALALVDAVEDAPVPRAPRPSARARGARRWCATDSQGTPASAADVAGLRDFLRWLVLDAGRSAE